MASSSLYSPDRFINTTILLERGRKFFEKVKRSRGLYLDGLYLALSKRATNNTLQLIATVEC